MPESFRSRMLALVAALAIALGAGATVLAVPASADPLPATGSSMPASEDGLDPWENLDLLSNEDLLKILDAIIAHGTGDVAKPQGSWFGPGTELLWAAILAGINPCAAMPWTC